MNRILVLYPREFKCQSKFDRKLSKITSNLDDYMIVFFDDHNDLIQTYISSCNPLKICDVVNCLDTIKPTHAVIFDDGTNFSEIIDKLSISKVPTRNINIEITRVVNIKRNPEYKVMSDSSTYQYIGRGSYWGNPYSIGGDGDRNEVIRKFEYDFIYNKFPNKEKDAVHKLKGKILGCFCKPDKCHGDVLADYLNSYDDGE
ncbi:MAG: DUF4326 domain-containing protein [Aliivibrio sp.]|uniref:DUF4326 domain-containing protein n=1 Tax=Aliivibrio sp. TaxID=1872443 RepID=UPI001A50E68F|nr:DUF4326 domain-containing protein [Aliivibrio sp.]